MIAPAMTTRNRQRLAIYRDLAREGANLTRTIEARSLDRLAELGQIVEPVEAQFEFYVHEGCPAVRGRVWARMSLPCQWCDEQPTRRIEAEFEGLLASDDEEAERWGERLQDAPVALVVGETLDEALIVEDELIMAVPGRVCLDESCSYRPAASYGEAPEEAEKPLGQLGELLSELKGKLKE